MTSQEVASLVDCGLTTIKRYTKKALENGLKTIEIKGLSFSFEVVSNSFGKAYSYTQIKQSSTKSKSAKTISFALLEELKDFDITKTSFEAVEKALLTKEGKKELKNLVQITPITITTPAKIKVNTKRASANNIETVETDEILVIEQEIEDYQSEKLVA